MMMADWVMPSEAQIEADGGYFGDDGMWVSDPYRKARANRRNVVAANAVLTPEMRSAMGVKGGRKSGARNIVHAHAALARQSPEERSAAARKASLAVCPDVRRANLAKACAAIDKDVQRAAARKNIRYAQAAITPEMRVSIGRLNRGVAKKTRNTSGHAGIRWCNTRSKWVVTLSKVSVGRFSKLEDAIAARKAAEAKHWG